MIKVKGRDFIKKTNLDKDFCELLAHPGTRIIISDGLPKHGEGVGLTSELFAVFRERVNFLNTPRLRYMTRLKEVANNYVIQEDAEECAADKNYN